MYIHWDVSTRQGHLCAGLRVARHMSCGTNPVLAVHHAEFQSVPADASVLHKPPPIFDGLRSLELILDRSSVSLSSTGIDV